MIVLENAIEVMTDDLKSLTPGSKEVLQQTQAIKQLAEADIEYKKLEFEKEKEETRKIESNNTYISNQLDLKIKVLDLGIKAAKVLADPAGEITKTIINNTCKERREIIGYNFEKDGVVGSTTLSNELKARV